MAVTRGLADGSRPALSADASGEDFVIASMISETERGAAPKAARAVYELWNAGDEAVLKQALAENFADHALPQGSERRNHADQRSTPPLRRAVWRRTMLDHD